MNMYNYELVASFHNNCLLSSMNMLDIHEQIYCFLPDNYLDKFVNKHSKIAFSYSNEDLDLDITEKAAIDIFRNKMKDDIKSGKINPFVGSDLCEILDCVPKGILDDSVKERIFE